MKVLTIVNSANMGGVEKTLLSCLKNLKNNDLKMTILCFQEGGSLEKDFRELGVEFIFIKKTGLIFLDMIQLLLVLIKNKFDLVHSRFGFTSGGFVLAARLVNIRIYVSLHSTYPSSFQSLKKKNVLFRLLGIHLKIHKILTKNFATKIIGHSKANLDMNYSDWEANSKFELLYNGVDFSELECEKKDHRIVDFVKENDFTILHVGSFRQPKNHTFLIDCFNLLKPKENNYKLILVGDGGLLEEMKIKVNTLGLSDFVFFAGFDKEINKYFNSSDLFFLPSLNEGLANVLIEAQFKEIPICVSDILPLYESGCSVYHKYYFNPRDKKDALDKLNDIILDVKLGNLKKEVEEAKNYAISNFSISVMIERLLKLYHEK